MQPGPLLPVIEYAERSDPGRDPEKQVNEDACLHKETRFGHLSIVCDGMGGHAAGREAAELAVTTIVAEFERAADATPAPQVLRTAIELANRSVYAMRATEVGFGRPGSTVVAVLMHARGTEVAHVGDSRAYLVHEGQIFRMTRDHSIVQELVDRGLLTPRQAAHHPDANRITRALGIAPEVDADVRATPVAHVAGDAFVLCSDGLSDMVEDDEILAVVAGGPAAQAAGKLVDLANARGGHDNITVAVLRARESADAAPGVVALTVAQTQFVAPGPVGAAAAPAAPASRTLVDVPVARPIGLESPSGRPPASRPLEPTPVAPDSATRRRRRMTATVVGLTLASIGAALFGVVLRKEISERGGKRNAHDEPALPLVVFDAGPDGPTALVPNPVELPAATPPPGGPIAPLEPGPAAPRKRKRESK